METLSLLMPRPGLLLLAAVLLTEACATPPLVRFPAVYLDMDGTALGTDHQVRPATMRALEQYKACGGQVGVATGRTLEQVRPFLGALAPTLPVVLFNGAVSVDPDGQQVRSVQRLEPGVVVHVLEAGAGDPDVTGIVVHDVEETVIDRKTEELDRDLEAGLIKPTRVHEGAAAAFSGNAVKVMVVTRPGTVDGVAARVGAAVGESARTLVTSPRTVEVVPIGVNKAVGILAALSQAGIDPAGVLLFGDSGNDVEMLSQVGIGIAMGNCRPEACDAAMLRIGNNGTDAIAQVIERLALTPSCPRQRPLSLPAPVLPEAPKTE
ncbi:MAG: HAD family phosphatase [Deltaproteobacteria bacterium]|nr:HAD family phosphatase [Deltaproteobacteria bacterium]